MNQEIEKDTREASGHQCLRSRNTEWHQLSVWSQNARARSWLPDWRSHFDLIFLLTIRLCIGLLIFANFDDWRWHITFILISVFFVNTSTTNITLSLLRNVLTEDLPYFYSPRLVFKKNSVLFKNISRVMQLLIINKLICHFCYDCHYYIRHYFSTASDKNVLVLSNYSSIWTFFRKWYTRNYGCFRALVYVYLN